MIILVNGKIRFALQYVTNLYEQYCFPVRKYHICLHACLYCYFILLLNEHFSFLPRGC